ncbi:MAG TPA: choice-of-anchor Q domain-containing protein, partial [bacterium]|nr:choice-of-anchor Q domain-containing protein [bacterium]
GEFGGAIYLNDSDSSVIKDTIFQYNVTYDYGDTDGKGGAIRISSSNLKIINSTFFKQISGIGGAVFSSAPDSETSTLTIINSGFSINKMINWGGAIYRTDSGSLNIVNSIFKSNTAGTGKHIHDAAGNATVTYSCIVDTTVYPGTGNINDEPMLTEPEWAPLDFTLKPESPCIDTGSNTPFDAGNIAEGITKDMSGNDRIIKGKETSPSAIVDMGAVEFKPAP